MGLTDHDKSNTPLDPNLRLPKLEAPESGIDPSACVGPNKRSMLSVIGSCLFIALTTRPDICYACSMLARHSTTPSKLAVSQLIRIVQYLNATSDLGLIYHRKGDYAGDLCTAFQAGAHPADPTKKELLRAWADSDFMGNWDRKSTSGWAICFNNTAAIFSSKLQSTTALSTAEAEVNSACEVSKSIVHMQLLLQELGFTEHLDKPCLVMEDNSSCVAFAHNLKSRKTTRHFELRVHYLQELVEAETVSFVQTATIDQLADLLTKALPETTFVSLRQQLLGYAPPQAVLKLFPAVVLQGGGGSSENSSALPTPKSSIRQNSSVRTNSVKTAIATAAVARKPCKLKYAASVLLESNISAEQQRAALSAYVNHKRAYSSGFTNVRRSAIDGRYNSIFPV